MTIASSRHFSKLVHDFVGNFDSSPIKDYFPCSPFTVGRDAEAIFNKRIAEHTSTERTGLRQAIITRIRQTHETAGGLTPEVAANLTLLCDPRCLAIVTGQQVGILGGPLYTIYKTLHTVLLAKKYNELYPSYSFVPVFWQETEDHDFAEVSSTVILDSASEIKHIEYQPATPTERKQVGAMRFEAEAINKFFDDLRTSLPSTDFTNDVIAMCERCYTSSATFAEAQTAILCELFANNGLLILNANARALKTFAIPIFEKELATTPQLSELIEKRSISLRKLYHAQLEPTGTHLFLVESGNRFKLHLENNSFRYGDNIITRNDLLDLLRSEPERFSMNVVMRPIVQDTLLPTAAYVAGPGETAYFAQLGAAYDWAHIQMPIIIPRISMTIVEEKIEMLVAKYQTSVEALIEFGAELTKEILKSDKEDEIIQQFAACSDTIEASLEQLRNITESVDPTLGGALTALKGKILTQVKEFSSKTSASERKKNSVVKQKFEKALNLLLPEGKLQERELNLIYFLNKYGFSFWSSLKEYVGSNDLSLQEHHIIRASTLTDRKKQPS